MSAQKHILVVEDNDFVRLQIAAFLKEAEFVVSEATDGDHALDVMDKNIALAIVDIQMEPMGGFDFISIIQAEGYQIPVMLVTGDQDHSLLERAGKHNVAAVLMKPVEKDRLLSTVNRLLAREANR